MKKFFCLMAMAIAAVTFTACSESDSEAVFSVDPSVSEGIVAELDGGFYKIPITANQGWSARLEDGCNWASLSDAEGKGSGSIEVCVDANYTGTGRKTNVLISSGDKVVTVPVAHRHLRAFTLSRLPRYLLDFTRLDIQPVIVEEQC